MSCLVITQTLMYLYPIHTSSSKIHLRFLERYMIYFHPSFTYARSNIRRRDVWNVTGAPRAVFFLRYNTFVRVLNFRTVKYICCAEIWPNFNYLRCVVDFRAFGYSDRYNEVMLRGSVAARVCAPIRTSTNA